MEAEYQTSKLARARWNVIDLLNHFSRRAVSAEIFCTIDVEAAERVCRLLSTDDQKVTITVLLLKAISIAQARYPASRSYRLPVGKIITPDEPIAGFTVERHVEDGPAVFFGVIHGAHEKSLRQIASEVKACGDNDIDTVPQLAKEHFISRLPWLLRQFYLVMGLHIPLLRSLINSATFGLTNVGKFGVQAPVAPNVTTTIIGVGAIETRPAAYKGRVVQRRSMQVCLSADTMVLNIYEGARLMHDVKALVQSGLSGHLTDEEKSILRAAGREERRTSKASKREKAKKLGRPEPLRLERKSSNELKAAALPKVASELKAAPESKGAAGLKSASELKAAA